LCVGASPYLSNDAACTCAGTRVAHVQRSCGYAERPTLSISEIGIIVKVVKAQNPDCIVLVDNCYGEFTEGEEPCAVRLTLPRDIPHPPQSSRTLSLKRAGKISRVVVCGKKHRKGVGSFPGEGFPPTWPQTPDLPSAMADALSTAGTVTSSPKECACVECASNCWNSPPPPPGICMCRVVLCTCEWAGIE
jgi:Methionine gamma-lyase